MASLGAPKVISPLIKFCRWGALAVGVGYGSMRYNYLARKEVTITTEHDAIRARIAVKQAEELAVKSKLEMNELGKDCGIPPIP